MSLIWYLVVAPLAVIGSVAFAAAILAVLEGIWNRTPWSSGKRRFD